MRAPISPLSTVRRVVNRLAAIAAGVVGRRVKLRNGMVGTVSRVNQQGLTVLVPGIRAEDIERWLD